MMIVKNSAQSSKASGEIVNDTVLSTESAEVREARERTYELEQRKLFWETAFGALCADNNNNA